MIIGTSENAYMALNPLHPGRLLKHGYVDADPDFPEDRPGMTVGTPRPRSGLAASTSPAF